MPGEQPGYRLAPTAAKAPAIAKTLMQHVAGGFGAALIGYGLAHRGPRP